MYINLRHINGVYPEKIYDDFMIYAQILDSGMSLDRPVLVRSVNELDIWFGRNFKGREHLLELLQNNISLYLFKQISNSDNKSQDGYIDTDSFVEDPKEYLDLSEIKDPKEQFKYKVLNEKGMYDIYIYTLGSLVNINELPQNLTICSESLSNRDTLLISDKPGIYSYFTYIEGGEYTLNSKERKVYDETNRFIWMDKNLLMGRLVNRYGSMMFSLKYDDKTVIDKEKEVQYFCLDGKIFYTSPDNSDLYKDGVLNIIMPDGKVVPGTLYNNSKSNIIKCSHTDNLLDKIKEAGIDWIGYIDVPSNTIYCTFAQSPVSICKWNGVEGIVPNFRSSWNIISEYIREDKGLIKPTIKFWSKTIGRDGTEDDSITISIKSLPKSIYEVTISRYDYKEVFEGSLTGSDGIERIDLILNRLSKLVNAELLTTERIPEGTWVMWGAEPEKYKTDNFEVYKNSFKAMFSKGEPVYPDFLLLPNLNCTIESEKWLLDNVKDLNTQVLIQSGGEETPLDRDNRLVYFYKSMYSSTGIELPGYYLFLKGLNNNMFSASAKDILYECPLDHIKVNILDRNSYRSELVNKLVKWKHNYLLDGGQYYYYDKLQSGESPNTSIWMRFCLGKIQRELEKLKPQLIGQRNSVKMRGLIETRLQKIKDRFSIIRDISINGFFYDPGHNKLYLEINTSVSDLVSEDIVLDLTINFK